MKGMTNAQKDVPNVPDAYVNATYSDEMLTLTKASGSKTELTIENGSNIIPAGKHQIYLQWQTEDRQNLSGVSFAVGSQTVQADAYGRAKVLVDSGSAVTISCTHSGSYSGDGPQTIDTPSAEQSFVYFYGSRISALDAYPVGSIYMSVNATNPSTILGGGTWERIAQGRTLIGEGTSDKTFSAGAKGGESAHALSTSEMPSHSHSVTPKGNVSLSLDSGTANMVSLNTNYQSTPGNIAKGTGIISAGNTFKEEIRGREQLCFGAFNSVGNGDYWSVKMNITPTGTATFSGSSSSTVSSGGGGVHTTISRHISSAISGNVHCDLRQIDYPLKKSIPSIRPVEAF